MFVDAITSCNSDGVFDFYLLASQYYWYIKVNLVARLTRDCILLTKVRTQVRKDLKANDVGGEDRTTPLVEVINLLQNSFCPCGDNQAALQMSNPPFLVPRCPYPRKQQIKGRGRGES